MILDNETMFADKLAFGSPPTVLDMGSIRPGPGEPLKIFVQGSADFAGATGIVITDGTTVAAADPLVTHVCDLTGKLVEFELPSDTAQFVGVALTGTPSAGTWTCGVTLPGNQTAV